MVSALLFCTLVSLALVPRENSRREENASKVRPIKRSSHQGSEAKRVFGLIQPSPVNLSTSLCFQDSRFARCNYLTSLSIQDIRDLNLEFRDLGLTSLGYRNYTKIISVNLSKPAVWPNGVVHRLTQSVLHYACYQGSAMGWDETVIPGFQNYQGFPSRPGAETCLLKAANRQLM